MPKVLIIGAGYLGHRFQEAMEDVLLTDKIIDTVRDVEDLLREYHPEAVLNCAGTTGVPNVDWCESHPVETYKGNTVLPLLLAEACQKHGIHLTHLGSGCVFYGTSPEEAGWREEDHANPSATYSRSKYAADLVLTTLPNVAIARLRMPIDSRPGARNLIDKLANYPKIIDVENSVTVVDDLIDVVRQLIEKRGEGIFHVVNPGTMRHKDLMTLYKELVDPDHTCEWITEDDLVRQGLAVKRRSNNIMQSHRLEEIGIHMRPINEALCDTMIKYAEAKRGNK
ncbi:sugar nucleotide-binding protein [Candidatus Uhrbacteria bacterium]|nr:sugar nucleotide-binding protein [Candidatus Uhrbacteria bacterium]MBD3284471.1 sugar nucleotide-binding protein [Candidatus Uhrbacteria bacterium]